MMWTARLAGTWPAVCLLGLLCGAARAGGAESDRGAWRSPVLLLGAARSTFDVGDQKGADPQPLWTPRLGVTYTAPRNLVTAFEFGLWADSRGAEWKDEGADLKSSLRQAFAPANTHQLRLVYLTVPLMLRVSLPGASLTPYVKGGLAPSVLLLARAETRSTATGEILHEYDSVRDHVNTFSLDALAGVGVRTNLAERAFILETLYLHGLTDVLKEGQVDSRPDLRSRSLQFFLGIGLLREQAAD